MAKPILRLPKNLPAQKPPSGWPPNQSFHGEEFLFRRIHPDDWDDLEITAFGMPDMSVYREKYCRARCALHKHEDWGVVQIRVRDVPQFVTYLGTTFYKTNPVHVPLDNSFGYPHSEVRAFDPVSGRRVSDPQYRGEADILWRERFLRACMPAVLPSRLTKPS